MTKIISIEEIGLCRSGPNNDIDLQAVFGGIKSRKQKGLKVNPVYDSNHGNIQNFSQDINGNINNVQVVTYTSIPESHTSSISDTSKPSHNRSIEHINGENSHRIPENNHKDANGNSDNSIENEHHLVNDNIKATASMTGSYTFGSPIGKKENNLNKSNGNKGDLNELSAMPMYEIKENTNGNGSKQVKEDINKNGIVLGVNGIMVKKNGSVNRETVVIESESIKTKPIAIPVLLSKVDKGENKCPDNVVEIENTKNKALEKRGSGYELLGYNNEGYIADENSIHLETVDDDASTRKNANWENSVLKIVSNQLNKKYNQVNPNQSNKKSEDESVINNDPVDDSREENENSKAANCVESVEKPSNVVVRTISSFSSTSEQSVKTEIVTEVHVHREDTNQNQINLDSDNQDLSNETRQIADTNVENCQTGDSQTTDGLNSEMKEVTDHLKVIDNLEGSASVLETDDSVTHLINKESSSTQVNKQGEEIIATQKEVQVKESVTDENVEVSESSKTVTFPDTEIQEESEGNGCKTNTSSTRTLKSILLTSNGKQHTPPDSPNNEQRDGHEIVSDIHEIKSVKFSEDTVFNENKSKRYKLDKMEKINLREIYRGKISCDSAMAKMNPIFHDDMESQDIEKSMSEDEKIAYQIALKKMMKSTGKGKDPTSPAYRDHYLILKANGIRPSNSDDIQTDLEKPAYDRLIQRTIAKERRKLIVKWVLVILVVAIVTTIATVLGVHFK